MLRRLRRVEAKTPVELGPDEVVVREAAFADRGIEARIEILAAVLEPKQEREVIHPGRGVVDLSERYVDVLGDRMDGPVDRVAEARRSSPRSAR
jgi:hypothetical protein